MVLDSKNAVVEQKIHSLTCVLLWSGLEDINQVMIGMYYDKLCQVL